MVKLVPGVTRQNVFNQLEALKSEGYYMGLVPDFTPFSDNEDYVKPVISVLDVDVVVKDVCDTYGKAIGKASTDVYKTQDNNYAFKKPCLMRFLNAIGGKLSDVLETKVIEDREVKEWDPIKKKKVFKEILKDQVKIYYSCSIEYIDRLGIAHAYGKRGFWKTDISNNDFSSSPYESKAQAQAARNIFNRNSFSKDILEKSIAKGVVLVKFEFDTTTKDVDIRNALKLKTMKAFGLLGSTSEPKIEKEIITELITDDFDDEEIIDKEEEEIYENNNEDDEFEVEDEPDEVIEEPKEEVKTEHPRECDKTVSPVQEEVVIEQPKVEEPKAETKTEKQVNPGVDTEKIFKACIDTLKKAYKNGGRTEYEKTITDLMDDLALLNDGQIGRIQNYMVRSVLQGEDKELCRKL